LLQEEELNPPLQILNTRACRFLLGTPLLHCLDTLRCTTRLGRFECGLNSDSWKRAHKACEFY